LYFMAYSFPTCDRAIRPRHIISTRISVSAPNSLTQYTHRGIPAHFLSLAGSRGSGQGPVSPNASPEAADCGLPMRFCQTPHRRRPAREKVSLTEPMTL
jgi:hypothetical protein